MLELGLTWLFDFIICVNYFRWLCYCDWWMQIDVCVYICSFKLILRSISMQFYTFLETTVVTLCLLPHFIAFFSEGEIPGTPGTLATTFLAFGNLISLIFILCAAGCLNCFCRDWWPSCFICSFESCVCIKCAGISYHAYILGGCKYYNYWGIFFFL